jgi:hypothetical protein
MMMIDRLFLTIIVACLFVIVSLTLRIVPVWGIQLAGWIGSSTAATLALRTIWKDDLP